MSATMTWTIYRESSCLANCNPLRVSVHCSVILYSPLKKLVFVPVVSATAGSHRDYPVLASVVQWPEIQLLVSRGQIVSADLL